MNCRSKFGGGKLLVAAAVVLASWPLLSFGGTKIESRDDLKPAGEKERLANHAVAPEEMTYKPGKGLSIASADGEFAMVPRLRLQALTTIQDTKGSDAQMGMMLRRARLQFVGHVFGKHNRFKSEFAFSPRDLRMTEAGGNTITRESPLLTWYMEFDYLRDLTVRLGQYKIPFSRQRVISSGDQQMVDRSIANGEFNLDRDIGLDIRSKDFLGLGMFRYYLGIYNGEGRSAYTNGDKNLMYLGRVEFLPLGMFNDYSEGDIERLTRPGLSIGLGYAYAKNAAGTRVNRNGAPDDEGTTDYNLLVADVTFKVAGLSLASELFWRDGDRNPGNAVDENGMVIAEEEARNGVGWFMQAGYLLPGQPMEISARFGQVLASDESSLGDQNEAGIAFSNYFGGHAFKLQTDLFQIWSDEFDHVTRLRVQLQLAF